MKTNPNDSAFAAFVDNGHYEDNMLIEGLSKREYFAAAAMQGIISKPHEMDPDAVAECAVGYADALTAALNK